MALTRARAGGPFGFSGRGGNFLAGRGFCGGGGADFAMGSRGACRPPPVGGAEGTPPDLAQNGPAGTGKGSPGRPDAREPVSRRRRSHLSAVGKPLGAVRTYARSPALAPRTVAVPSCPRC